MPLPGDTYPGNRFSIKIGKLNLETIQSVSAITIDQEVVETRYVNSKGQPQIRKQNGSQGGGEVTVVRGMDPSKAFTEWIQKTRDNADLDGARDTVTITQYDSHGAAVRSYVLRNAWASRWESNAFDASDTSQATETVTITYEKADFA